VVHPISAAPGKNKLAASRPRQKASGRNPAPVLIISFDGPFDGREAVLVESGAELAPAIQVGSCFEENTVSANTTNTRNGRPVTETSDFIVLSLFDRVGLIF
jgi:hypothetical protein